MTDKSKKTLKAYENGEPVDCLDLMHAVEQEVDEKKAEDYYEGNECYSHLSEIKDFEEVFGFVKDRVKKAFLDGLAEGRKEVEKEDIYFCNAFCMKADKRALLEQIEKMKCCGNCKIDVKDEEYPCCECDGKNKWEAME